MKKRILLAGATALMMFAACTDDNILDEGGIQILPDAPVDGVVKMHMTAADADRVEYLPVTRGFYKWQKLEWVATIKNPTAQDRSRVWSATAVAFDEEKHRAYITWHSDRQADHEAQVWGGAIDEVDITEESARRIFLLRTGTNDLLKYNNVLVHNGKLYLSATSARVGGTVARIDIEDFQDNDADVEVIGFPGTSVNAVAPMNDGKLIGISGYDPGAYATFPADIKKNETFSPSSSDIKILNDGGQVVENFGGKYVTTDEKGDVYILYDPLDGTAKIQKIGNGEEPIDLGIELISGEKYAETYTEAGGWEPLEGETATHYGKHALAVRNGYAYVAAGKGTDTDTEGTGTGEKVDKGGGLRVYDLAEKKLVWYNNTYTAGVYADSNYVYAATGAGLRIYSLYDEKAKGDTLFAYEVENYNEGVESNIGDGTPVKNEQTWTGSNTKRHSPNFVVAHRNYKDNRIYIYIAYGQSGVRVYRFRTEPEGPEDPGESDIPTTPEWSENNMPDGYFAFGELFCDEDDWAGNTTIVSQVDSGKQITMNEYYEDIKKSFAEESVWKNKYWPNTEIGTPGKGYYHNHSYVYYKGSSQETYKKNNKDTTVTKYNYVDSFLVKLNSAVIFTPGVKVTHRLNPRCDAAQVRLGNGWRIPTIAEWREMLVLVGLIDSISGKKIDSVYKQRFIPQFLPNKAGTYRWVFRLYPYNDEVNHADQYIDFPCNGHYENHDITQAWNKGNWCKETNRDGHTLHAWEYVTRVNQFSPQSEIDAVNKELREWGWDRLNAKFKDAAGKAGNDDSPECNYWSCDAHESSNAYETMVAYSVEMESFRYAPKEIISTEELWKGLQLRPVRDRKFSEVGEIEPEKQPKPSEGQTGE